LGWIFTISIMAAAKAAVVGRCFRHFGFGGGIFNSAGYVVPTRCGDKNIVMAVVGHFRADIVVAKGSALVWAFMDTDLGSKGSEGCFIAIEDSKELGVCGEFGGAC
jgi:hypothetical protein